MWYQAPLFSALGHNRNPLPVEGRCPASFADGTLVFVGQHMDPVVHPRRGAATGSMAVGRELRHLLMALWNAMGFRAVRGAGISLAAASGSFARCGGRPGALPPGPLRFFEKNRVKLLNFGGICFFWFGAVVLNGCGSALNPCFALLR